MKKIFALALLAVAASAFADTTAGSGSGAGQTTTNTSTATGTATNAGNAQSITFTSPDKTTTVVEGGTASSLDEKISGTQTIKNVPSVNAPPLVTSNDTCMGSASAGVGVAGFGLSLGKTYTDVNCVMLKNSRELWNMGMRAASLALMCNDPLNKDALEMTGFECPQTRREHEKRDGVKTTVVTPAGQALVLTPEPTTLNSEPTDPIVRRRMGLPAIKE
jgi:hypothetical protein